MRRLADLKQIREQLEWLEFAAWLHNLSKCSPLFTPTSNFRGWSLHADKSKLVDDEALRNAIWATPEVTLEAEPTRVEYLIARHLLPGRPGGTTYIAQNLSELLLAHSHENASGPEKRSVQREQAETAGDTDAVWDTTLLTESREQEFWNLLTPFGSLIQRHRSAERPWHELHEITELATAYLAEIQNRTNARRKERLQLLDSKMGAFPAETQFPICDVRVSDMGFMVAALLKAAAAGFWLTGRLKEPLSDAAKIQWSLLRVAVDGPRFAAAAVRLTDIVARRTWVQGRLNELCTHVEESLCIGNEVLRTEEGSVFLIFADSVIHRELRSDIEAKWRDLTDGELAAECQYSDPFRLGPEYGYSHQMGSLLKKPPPPPSASIEFVQSAWAGKNNAEICPTCGIRPKSRETSEDRKQVCQVGMSRRASRANAWLKDPGRTIWLDELADDAGRFAVVQARFRIEEWLLPKGTLERTCFRERFEPRKNSSVEEQSKKYQGRNIAPSSVRIRRLLETTQGFWTRFEERWLAACPVIPKRLAVEVHPAPFSDRGHSWELVGESGTPRVSAVWTGAEFLVVENLARLRDLNPEADRIFKRNDVISVVEPGGLSSLKSESDQKKFTVVRVSDDNRPWKPYLQIRLDPTSFQCLVPANQSIHAAAMLESMFAKEMARVRHKIGFDITVIAGPKFNPLRAFLDAARRADARAVPQQVLTVTDVVVENWSGNEFGESAAAYPKCVHLAFHDGSSLSTPVSWPVASKQGSAKLPILPDDYFPYFEVEAEPGKDPVPVHATQLHKGQRVRIAPSTFDYEFLDSSSRRFDLAYDRDGRRRKPVKVDPVHSRGHRPWAASAIHELRYLLQLLESRLSRRQTKILDGLLAAKQMEWDMGRAELDSPFIQAVLANLEYLPGARPFLPSEADLLLAAAHSGLLHDAVEILTGVEKSSKEEAQ